MKLNWGSASNGLMTAAVNKKSDSKLEQSLYRYIELGHKTKHSSTNQNKTMEQNDNKKPAKNSKNEATAGCITTTGLETASSILIHVFHTCASVTHSLMPTIYQPFLWQWTMPVWHATANYGFLCSYHIQLWYRGPLILALYPDSKDMQQ